MSRRCTPPTRPRTGFESSAQKRSTARSRTSTPTKSISHSLRIHDRESRPGSEAAASLAALPPPSYRDAATRRRVRATSSFSLLQPGRRLARPGPFHHAPGPRRLPGSYGCRTCCGRSDGPPPPGAEHGQHQEQEAQGRQAEGEHAERPGEPGCGAGARPPSRRCSSTLSATTPLYSTAVCQTLRYALRCPTSEAWCSACCRVCQGGAAKALREPPLHVNRLSSRHCPYPGGSPVRRYDGS